MKTEIENIHHGDFHVLHACAACLNAIDDPHPGLNVSKNPGQADYGLPGKQQECY